MVVEVEVDVVDLWVGSVGFFVVGDVLGYGDLVVYEGLGGCGDVVDGEVG